MSCSFIINFTYDDDEALEWAKQLMLERAVEGDRLARNFCYVMAKLFSHNIKMHALAHELSGIPWEENEEDERRH